ncbi:MAG: gamma-glutamyltransferase [Synechococcaceae cyanobacterium]|nr:gamma-glutamyltransferase [Synechococcaceae cyanobacterium]
MLEPNGERRAPRQRPPMRPPTRAAIAADSPLTVQAGLRIAEAGGNAVDIAVAAAVAATLAEILMASLGGSGFLMLDLPGQPSELIEGADAVPAGPGDGSPPAWWVVHLPYGDGITVRAGPASVAVPGLPAALHLAWSRHGSLPWRELLAPALEMARTGTPMGRTTALWLSIAGTLLFDRQAASRACFPVDPADPPRPGRLMRLPGLADSLELLAAEGAEAFYRGALAEAFAAEMAATGGLVTRRDLAAYRAQVRQPLVLASGGFHLDLNPPPAVGGLALASLIRLLERDPAPANEAARTRRRVEAQRRLARLRPHLGPLRSPHTTHLSVATADGALVAVTMSNGYGSGITIPGTGIPCNNSLGEPELNPLGFLAAEPGARMVSNMAPTLARHPDGRRYAFGTPGASRITTAMAQVWERHTLEGLPLAEAIDAPRLHLQSDCDPPLLLCEPGLDLSALDPELTVRCFAGPDMYFGGIKVAGRSADGNLVAHADRRREGAVAFSG